ncbi:MAG TPA: serine hydrolase domain-containing protein [Bacteroidales bacterium]|nr:serine hydrolase domain-containing protein [Bacteroidales bacterium]
MRKIILKILFFAFFFLLGIGMSFSDMGHNENFMAYRNQTVNSEFESPVQSKAVSYQLNNKLSDYTETKNIDLLVTNLLEKDGIKGASVAISYQSKLVYAKGFGYANIETKEKVKPKHLFRIASVSKLITAVAIMKLVEDGKLHLFEHVFGPLGILNDPAYLDYSDKRFEDITVDQLLHHTAGWGPDQYDPLFLPQQVAKIMDVSSPPDIPTTIAYTLKQGLRFKPGTIYHYSNIGYVILGQVIAKVSGMDYEDYVTSAILHPIGVYDMHIGKNFYIDKAPNEVTYYDTEEQPLSLSLDGSNTYVPAPYGGNNIEALSAAGGWIASASGLLQFILAIDGFPEQPDILSKKSIKKMVTPDKNGNSLIGWRGADGKGTWWRTGTLSGTSALVMRQSNKVNWVVLFNSSSEKRNSIHRDISRTMFTAVYSVKDWPGVDLFEYCQPKPLEPVQLASLNY